MGCAQNSVGLSGFVPQELNFDVRNDLKLTYVMEKEVIVGRLADNVSHLTAADNVQAAIHNSSDNNYNNNTQITTQLQQ